MPKRFNHYELRMWPGVLGLNSEDRHLLPQKQGKSTTFVGTTTPMGTKLRIVPSPSSRLQIKKLNSPLMSVPPPNMFRRSELKHCVKKSFTVGATRTHGVALNNKQINTSDVNSLSSTIQQKFPSTKQQLRYIRQQMQTEQTNYPLYINRLLIGDRKSSLQYLIDSGADVSVISPSMTEKGKCKDKTNDSISWFAASGSVIKTYDQKRLELSLGLRRPFTWTFIIADVQQPIIGADFIKNYGLLIDLANDRRQKIFLKVDLKKAFDQIEFTRMTYRRPP